MNGTHDYETKEVKVTALNGTHVIVGDCGGLSAVFDVVESTLMPELYLVETEHGTMYFDPDEKLTVLADEELSSESDEASIIHIDIDGFINVDEASLIEGFKFAILKEMVLIREDIEKAMNTSLKFDDNEFTVSEIKIDSNNELEIKFIAHYLEDS